jgi:hypothetical protein
MPSFADIGCRVVSVTDPYGFIFGFLDLRKDRVNWKKKCILLIGTRIRDLTACSIVPQNHVSSLAASIVLWFLQNVGSV